MDRIVYDALCSYFHVLEVRGYVSYPQMIKLLVLCFYRDFVYNDYRALLKRDDYHLIERALDCLYGSTCLIPYPDYLNMEKLHLGNITEIVQRVKNLEDTPVLKPLHDYTEGAEDPESDISVVYKDN